MALEMAQCIGSRPPGAADINFYSDDFSQGSGAQITAIFSHVTAVPSVSLAQADLAAMRSAKTLQCIRQSVARQPAGQVNQSGGPSAELTNFEIKSFPVDLAGTDGGFGYRFTFASGAQATAYAVKEDAMGFVDGNIEVALATVAIGQPIPTAIEQHLLSVLVSRARSAIH